MKSDSYTAISNIFDCFNFAEMDDRSGEAFKVGITNRLRKNQRKFTFWITIGALISTIIFIFVAFLVSAKQKTLVEKIKNNEPCSASCSIKLAETIPSGMKYDPSAIVHPPIVNELKTFLQSAKKSVDIASSYWTLQASDVKGGPYPMASAGEEIFTEIINAARRGIHSSRCKITALN